MFERSELSEALAELTEPKARKRKAEALARWERSE
jgi:hypothetical protein